MAEYFEWQKEASKKIKEKGCSEKITFIVTGNFS
jgi:hypothetical protein